MGRYDVVGSEMAVHAVGTSVTSMLASTAFRGSERLHSGTNEPGLQTKQNLRAKP